MFVWNATKKNKLDTKWRSHFRITEQVSRDTFWVKNQLTGEIKKIHAKNLGRAWLEDWPMPDPDIVKRSRATKFVVAPMDSPTASETESDDSSDHRQQPKRRPERRRLPRARSTLSEQSTGGSDNSQSHGRSIDQAGMSSDDPIMSIGDPNSGDPDPNQSGTDSSGVNSDDQNQVPTELTDSDDIPLARLRERLIIAENGEPVLTVTPSSSDKEINEPAAEIVPPAAHRYPQRTRKAPAYLQDYCAINAEGHGLRVTSV